MVSPISWPVVCVAVFLVVGAAATSMYLEGRDSGQAAIQKKWDASKANDEKLVAAEKKRISEKETAHRAEVRKITNELVASQAQYAEAVFRARSDAAVRLRSANNRAAVYRSQADSGATAAANLASHATQLDRAVSEGIGLVEELKATVEFRDTQLRALATQIETDRALFGQSEGS